MAAGSRAATDRAKRDRAPGVVRMACMLDTVRTDRPTDKVQFDANRVGRFGPRSVGASGPRPARAARRPAPAGAARGRPLRPPAAGGAAPVVPRPGPRAGPVPQPGARVLRSEERRVG